MDDFSIGDEVSFVITPNCDKVIHMKLEKHVEEHNLTEFAAPGLSRRLDLSRAAEDHLKPNSGELEVIQKLKQVLLITRIGHHYMDQSSLYQFCLASVTETFKQMEVMHQLCTFHWNNRPHSLRHIPCKLNLMVIYMFIELVLARHNNRSFTYLQRHDKTCRTTVSNHNTGIGHIFYHLLIWN